MFLGEFNSKERIFIDANIFIYNALDNPEYAQASSDFLRLVETNQIMGVITPFVMDEVLFKILIAEASMHIENFTLRKMKKEMKKAGFSSMIYKPVKEYCDYFKELTYGGLEILAIDAWIAEKSVELGMQYGLMTADAMHLSAMKQYGIVNMATNDSDFENVEFLRIFKP